MSFLAWLSMKVYFILQIASCNQIFLSHIWRGSTGSRKVWALDSTCGLTLSKQFSIRKRYWDSTKCAIVVKTFLRMVILVPSPSESWSWFSISVDIKPYLRIFHFSHRCCMDVWKCGGNEIFLLAVQSIFQKENI